MEPKQVYDLTELFEAVQLSASLGDGKTFPDCVPKMPLADIEKQFKAQRNQGGFDLRLFVETHFDLPSVTSIEYHSDTAKPLEEHLAMLWPHLTRQPQQTEGSLINLPFPYIVPGGRFREIYYWDSYFTMLGLLEHGHVEMVENMIDNFAFLITTYGHIPNGNRTYYLSRSQPPFFALMVELLASAKKDETILQKYCHPLQLEYAYWQKGSQDASTASHRTVKLEDGSVLNRYFDESPTPRQESYAEDIHISQSSQKPAEELFTHIRAGAESGWDFSSRWFADKMHISTIETTSIIPIDLNCLLYKLEQVLAKAYQLSSDVEESECLAAAASKRLDAIIKYCWNDELQYFTDYHWVSQHKIAQVTAAGLVPLFVSEGRSDFINDRMHSIRKAVQEELLKPGGLVTTAINSGQQWDAPNGWAPLQWMAVKGLSDYGATQLATEIAARWTAQNERVFKATGKMMEKYNVEDLNQLAGGGEYESQDGFGWTNGVYLALKRFLGGSLPAVNSK
ncbi:MAG: alpha,alpha-trehalase TreF [Chitinophagaceae bacterium]